MKALCLQHLNTRRAAFLVVCWLYACIHLDRQIPAILAQSVKSDLGLSDQQLGAFTGSTFAIVYALLGLYFGGLADRLDRLRLVRCGAWVWSLSCIGGALAANFAGLVLCRAGIAVGEAVATAAAVSLIAELAGERYRGRLASVFLTNAFIGAGAAAILGGALIEHFKGSGALAGWRAALVAAGVPGLLGAVCLGFFGSEGARSQRGPLDPTEARFGTVLIITSLLAIVAQMHLRPLYSAPVCTLAAGAIAWWWSHWLRGHRPASFAATWGHKPFRYFMFAFAAVMFVDYSAAFWLIPFAQRRYGVSAGEVGRELGTLLIGAGIIGCLAGGWMGDRWRAARSAGRVWTALVAVLLEGAAIVGAVMQNNYTNFTVAFAVFCAAGGAWAAVAAATAFDIVPAEHLGTGTAAYFLVTTLLGPALGPVAVGIGSDLYGSIGTMLSWACSVVLIAAIALVNLGLLVSKQSRAPSQRTTVRASGA